MCVCVCVCVCAFVCLPVSVVCASVFIFNNSFPLFDNVYSVDQQRAVFEPAGRGVRKVIVATNIAGTSLTIDGIR